MLTLTSVTFLFRSQISNANTDWLKSQVRFKARTGVNNGIIDLADKPELNLSFDYPRHKRV